MSEEKREYTVRGVQEQMQKLREEEDRKKEEEAQKEKEAPIVISWDADGHFSCERSDDKDCFDDPGKLTNHVARLLAWRRDEPEDLRYSPTAEEFVGDLVTSGRGNSVEIPFDLNLDAGRYSSEAEWTSDDVRKT